MKSVGQSSKTPSLSDHLREVESVEAVPLAVVPQVEMFFKLDHNGGVVTGIRPLHPPEHDARQLQILAPYGLAGGFYNNNIRDNSGPSSPSSGGWCTARARTPSER